MASLGFGFWCCLGRKKGRQDPHARKKIPAPRLHPKGAISSLVYFPSLCSKREGHPFRVKGITDINYVLYVLQFPIKIYSFEIFTRESIAPGSSLVYHKYLSVKPVE